MKLKLLILLVFGCTFLPAFAQEKLVTKELPVYFVYAEGQRTDGKLKVLYVSTYLFRAKNFSLPGQSTDVSLSLDYSEVVDKLKFDEDHFPQDYNNIRFGSPVIESFYGSYLNWHPSDIRFANITSEDNTLSAMEKFRIAFIEDYIRKGYTVLQYNFNPQINGPNATGYRYYDSKSLSYKPYQFDKLLPLSPLWIRVYQKGDIKAKLATLSERSTSGSSGLVIESKKENNKSTTSGNKTTTETKSDEYWANQVAIARMQAEALEAEGDKLYRTSTYLYPEALKKYLAAQQLYPTARVQQRVDEIQGWMALGQGLNQLGEGIEKGVEAADPRKVTRVGYGFFNYTGLLTTPAQKGGQQPMNGLFGILLGRLFISAELRMGYMVAPVVEYEISKGINTPTEERVLMQQSGFGMGFSGGINIPTKHVVAYAMYGSDMLMFPTQHKFISEGYSAEDPLATTVINKWIFGAVVNIPKSKLAIGLQYNLNKLRGDKETGGEVKHAKYGASDHYYLEKPVLEEYKYQNVGISFAWKI